MVYHSIFLFVCMSLSIYLLFLYCRHLLSICWNSCLSRRCAFDRYTINIHQFISWCPNKVLLSKFLVSDRQHSQLEKQVTRLNCPNTLV